MAPALARDAHAARALERVLVIDTRCARWPGLGDSANLLVPLLRLGHALRRATFLWTDPCVDDGGGGSPRRLPGHASPPEGACAFDAGAFFTGLGGTDWRWTRSARARVAARHPHAAEVELAFKCSAMEQATGVQAARCADSTFHHANGTLAAALAGGDALWAYLSDELAPHPWLRLELCYATDLQGVASSRPACVASGVLARDHNPNAAGCGDPRCELFAMMRPRRALWRELDKYAAPLREAPALVAVAIRTGVADHAARQPGVLAAEAAAMWQDWGDEEDDAGHAHRHSAGAGDAPATAAERQHAALEALFTPCPPNATRVWRGAQRGAPPCISWFATAAPEERERVPDATFAQLCGVESATDAAALAMGNATDAVLPPLMYPGLAHRGPLGAVLECAAQNGARAAAARAGVLSATAGKDNGGNGTAAPGAFVVLLATDAPALKCALEAGPIGASGRALITPSRLGHVQYASYALSRKTARAGAGDARPGAHAPESPAESAARRAHELQLLTAAEFFLMGWAEQLLILFASSFANAAAKRSFSIGNAGVRTAMLAPGFEQWFVAGREMAAPDADVDNATLRLLAATNARACPRAALPADDAG